MLTRRATIGTVRRGTWDDGKRIGKQHNKPYLQPEYARSIADGSKTIEGRPLSGWAEKVAPNDVSEAPECTLLCILGWLCTQHMLWLR